ncbi:MAG TPA: cytochrome-c peroxidase [Gammaproteobacteria bacterium]|nr:cytochrome-c peroxidase [Gammaproteobacteria bacterium]
MKYRHFITTLFFGSMLAGSQVCASEHGHHRRALPEPVTDADFRAHTPEKVELGRLLMFDKLLSGNRNTSCATCHHSLTDTGDGLSLPVGEGGRGLGVTRDTGSGADAIHERVPRNAPPVFNLGAHEFTRLFYDGRVELDPAYPSGCKTPAGESLPDNLENVLACQAMFPVTSATEMAGQPGENPVADAAAAGDLEAVWALLAARLQDPANGYLAWFQAAFPAGTPNAVTVASDITYAHAANAIAAFEGSRWRADNSPFDRYLRGDRKAMSKNALRGMQLFYRGNRQRGHRKATVCADCHSGKFQTDHRFHAIAMPQIGPGKGDGYLGRDDFGREQASGDPADRYSFRTPTLRNVALTAPYGHSGAYNSLRAVVDHHLDAVNALYRYDTGQAILPSRDDLDASDFLVTGDPASQDAVADAVADELRTMHYSEDDIDYIMDFLNALTDPASIDLRRDVPESVPSGLTLAE